MWNWLVTVLASKASIVLFDGFPMYRQNDLLLKIADNEKITLFGISAKYIDALRNYESRMKYKYDLKELKQSAQLVHLYQKMDLNMYIITSKKYSFSFYFRWYRYCILFCIRKLYQPVKIGEIQNQG